MTHEQYEEQKRRLAEQRQALMEMVETAHQLQLRALEIVWRMISGEGAVEPLLPRPAAPPPPAPAPSARRRQRAGELYQQVLAALPRLPDPFVQADLPPLLGYPPDRGSLFRVLHDLIDQDRVAIVVAGMGNQPTRYRTLHRDTPQPQP
jgi:hypothetical protein